MHPTSLTLFRDIRRPGPRYSRRVDVSLRPITDQNRAAVLALELAPWQRRFVRWLSARSIAGLTW